MENSNEIELERKTVKRISEWIQTLPLLEDICPLCDGYCSVCSCYTNNNNHKNNNSDNSSNSNNNNTKTQEVNSNNSNTRTPTTNAIVIPSWTSVFKPIPNHLHTKETYTSPSIQQQQRRLVSRTT